MTLISNEQGKKIIVHREGDRLIGTCILGNNLREHFERVIRTDEKGEYFLFHTRKHYLSEMTAV